MGFLVKIKLKKKYYMGLFKIDVYLNALGKKDQVSFSLDDLKRYDPSLLSLIQEIFPCDNAFISKCKSSRGKHSNYRII